MRISDWSSDVCSSDLFGGKIAACSDSSGYVVDEDGIDLALVKEIKEVRRERISEYVRLKGRGAHFIEEGSVWDVPCDIAMPSATQNELTGKDANMLVKNGVIAVGEGANMPSTPEAVRIFQEAGVLFAPGKAANAGGVATRSEEHTSELQSLMRISYAVFCWKKNIK